MTDTAEETVGTQQTREDAETGELVTTEFGVRAKVTSEYGTHRGPGYHSVRYWSAEPDSAKQAKEAMSGEPGVVEVYDDVKTRTVPAPEGWFDAE